LANSLVVVSSFMASSATSNLNFAVCRFRFLDIFPTQVFDFFSLYFLLNLWSSFWGSLCSKLINAHTKKELWAEIALMSDDDEINYIWADMPVKACLDVSVPKIAVPKIWNMGLQGEDVRLAIVDSGIDPNHPDFVGRIKYRGVAPKASLYIAKVLDEDGNGTMSSVMEGIEWVANQGVQVINFSLAGLGPSDGSDALSTISNTVVKEKGIVVIVAAGNDGSGEKTIGSPGAAEFVITVGASDDNDNVPSFSSRGPTEDGRIKPDIVLPGDGIIAAQAEGATRGVPVSEGYMSLDGTSQAAPHVAGAVCLFLQKDSTLTPSVIKGALEETAIKLPAIPNTAQGEGRANIYRALQKLTAPAKPTDDSHITIPDKKEAPGCLASLSGLFH
ncbi:MAG: hypothetical protein B6242_03380, partial [Anaerolineaceae bacterium 4572_78]